MRLDDLENYHSLSFDCEFRVNAMCRANEASSTWFALGTSLRTQSYAPGMRSGLCKRRGVSRCSRYRRPRRSSDKWLISWPSSWSFKNHGKSSGTTFRCFFRGRKLLNTRFCLTKFSIEICVELEDKTPDVNVVSVVVWSVVLDMTAHVIPFNCGKRKKKG